MVVHDTVAGLALPSIMLHIKALDRRDGGGRLALCLALLGKWLMGFGAVLGTLMFLRD